MEGNVAVIAIYIGRILRTRLDVAARQFGITALQWRMLSTLQHMPGSNQGALASLLRVEPITAGRMIDRLEKLELIERRSDPADRRAWRLYVTDSSEQLMGSLAQCVDNMCEDALTGFSAEEHAALVELMARMLANLSDEAPLDGLNLPGIAGGHLA
nr:MarR family transcriptional regulator [uncultured Shinella sp.]